MTVSVVIVLPLGVENVKDHIRVNVSGCCRKLVVTMNWPSEITDTMKIHRWMQKEAVEYHPRLLEYERSLGKRRHKINEGVTSRATISLPCKVMRSVDGNRRFKFANSTTQVMYIDLQADKHSDYRDDDANEVIEL